MRIQENVSMAPLTTFGVGGPAKYFITIENADEVKETFAYSRELENNADVFVFGGGSNIVVSNRGFDGVVLNMDNKGIDVVKETGDDVFIEVASGEVWDDVVGFAVEHSFWGIENMSYVPGRMGAFAVQNVGAYGQEASEVVESVFVYDREKEETKVLSKNECKFEYRKSIFNSSEKGKYIILKTTLKLSKTPNPNIDYVDVKNYFEKHNITNPTIRQIRDAIIDIRKRKFADPDKIGTAGSFFKNLYISQDEYAVMRKRVLKTHGREKADMLEEIKNKFPSDGNIKIPTAFIIDKICELKGARIGGAMVSETQALAIINPEKKATSDDVMRLIQLVRKKVYESTTIQLDVEPELVGFAKEELSELFSL